MKKTAGKASEAVKTKPLPRTSPSSKMSLNHLRPPPEMKIPSRVELKQSTVDENCLGVWSKRPFKKGEVFGPFMGKKVMDAADDMDPSYVWEIVDKESKEFLFYIDATNLRNANWMRYINCARHFDEQNIISEQIDVDIFYKVIKDIPPGEELLTWYKKPKLRKKPSRKRQLSCASSSGSGEKTPRKAEKTPGKAQKTPGKVEKTRTKTEKTPGKTEKTPVKVMKLSSPRKDGIRENGFASSKVKVERVIKLECETLERDIAIVKTPPKKALKLTRTRIPKRRRKSRSGRDTDQQVPVSVMVKPDDDQVESLVNGCFQFNMKDYHMVKGRSGRRLFRCDICSSVYRHAFSLKRHYIRSHINYFFVSKMDRLNCNVSAPEGGATQYDQLNFVVEDDLDLPDDDIGEDAASGECCVHGSDADKTDVGGKSGYVQREDDCVASEEPDSKRRKVSSDAEAIESCEATKSNDIDADNLTSDDVHASDCPGVPENDTGEKETVCAADAQIDGGVSDPANSISNDKLDKTNNASDEKKTVGADSAPGNKKCVGAPEENSSSTVDGAPSEVGPGNSAPHKDTDVSSAPEECTVKNAPDEDKTCTVDQAPNKTSGTAYSTRGDNGAGSNDSAPEDKVPATVSSAHDETKQTIQSSASKENGPSVTNSESDDKCSAPDDKSSAPDEKSSAPDDKSSAADEKTAKKNSAQSENKLGNENNAKDKNTEVVMNGALSAGRGPHSGAPSEDTVSENGVFSEDHGPENYVEDDAGSNLGSGTLDGSSDVMSRTVNCSSADTTGTAGEVDETNEQKSNDSASDEQDNSHSASDDNCDISNELQDKLQDKQCDITCNMSDVTKQSDDSNAPLRGDGVALVYRCHICHCHLVTKLALKHHLVEHSQDGLEQKVPDMKVFTCDQCEMTFLSVQNLARHQTVHSGEKPFNCRYCNKKFPTVTNQRRHERIHQGRRFCCGHCQRSFTQTGDLKKHISKLHPELFHECVLCGKYFGSGDLLEEHLGSHGNSVRQNWKAVSMERGTHRANLELDRAESMKLATVKPGRNFACTICRKLFDDYANMCRHRRLAHQRNSILNVRIGKSANRCCVKVEPPNGGDGLTNSMDCDESEDAFYARIAENISDNLTNFLEGKKVHLDNCYDHINEKLHPSNQPVLQRRRRHSSSDVTRINVTQYNFPKTFRLRSSRTIENCDKQDSDISKDHVDSATEQTPASEKASADSSVNDDAAATDAELMHVPKVRQCVQCRRNFHTFKSYHEHMYIRHKTLVPNDVNKSEDWRNEQPISPPDHDRIVAPLLSHKLRNNSADMPATTNKSKLSYSGWKNGLLTGIKKDVCSVGDGPDPSDTSEVLDTCDLLISDEEMSKDKDADNDKPFNYKLNLVARCYICNVCNEQFNCFDSLVDHQYDLHPNVYCTHLEVAVDGRPASWLQTAPVGLLRVTTNHVPAVEDFKRSTKSKFRCTKCNKPFASMLELHTHITECASEGMPVIEPPVIVKHSTKYKVKTIKGRKKIQHATTPTLTLSPGYETFHADDLDTGRHDNAQERHRKKRRKNFELLYNPLHHVRRRELTQVLEIHNCGGCHQQFETISLLERHVRICKQKDKFKELRAISASHDVNVDDDDDDEYAYDPTKHMCIYCLRQFTYLGMLRKHVSEWCQVRQDFIDHGELLDDEWEETLEVKGSGKKKEGRLSRQSSFSSLNGTADSQDVEERNRKGTKPKWGNKWKCGRKQVVEPPVKLESESSTDGFSEQRRSASLSGDSRIDADDVESSQESNEFKREEKAGDCLTTQGLEEKAGDCLTTQGLDEKDSKPFSGLLKTNDKVDENSASAEKDIIKSDVQVERVECAGEDISTGENISELTKNVSEVKSGENPDSSEKDRSDDGKRKSEPLDTAVVTPEPENACSEKSQKHESGDNGKCKVAQSCDVPTSPRGQLSNQTSFKIPKCSGLAKVM